MKNHRSNGNNIRNKNRGSVGPLFHDRLAGHGVSLLSFFLPIIRGSAAKCNTFLCQYPVKISEDDLADDGNSNPHVEAVRKFAAENGSEVFVISAEIEQEISLLAGHDITLSFNTHILPTNRGILSTIYTKLKNPATTLDEVREVYTRTWEHSPWIRILPKGALPETRFVRGSMFCDLGLVVDPRTGRLIIISAIDNLCRGASGQAMANANLMCGLPVETGLNTLAPLA